MKKNNNKIKNNNDNFQFNIKSYNFNIEVNGNNHFSNKIKTTKYTWLNFLPLAIFYQFKKIPNIYFLILSILVLIPGISPIDPFLRVATFAGVISVSWLKELIFDIKRFKNNLEINNKEVEIIRNNKLIKSKYKSIKLGDVIILRENDFVPADIIILCNEKNKNLIYIETSNLDGEKTLKPKYFIENISNYFYDNKFSFSNLDYEFRSQTPNHSINNMNGSILFKNKKYTITNKQFIPRGCKIKDENKIYGLVIFVGHDTKIMLNTAKKGYKLSHLEYKMNYFIISIISFQLFLIILSVIFNYIYNAYFNRFQFQGYTNENKITLAFLNFLSYLVLLANLIPISLIVTIELSRIAQAITLFYDDEMYDAERNIRQKIFTTNINEELGQINFILSDKTGTLTINKMVLNFLNIGYNIYDVFFKDNLKINNYNNILKLKVNNNKGNLNNKIKDSKNSFKNIEFKNENEYPIKFFSNDNNDLIEFSNEKEIFYFYVVILLSCHDCFIKKDNNNLVYNGESPDEIAFLDKLKELNIILIKISENEIELSIFGEKIIIQKLGIIEFDNVRKCMTVITNYKINDENKYFLFIKGADNSLFNKSNKNNLFHDIINKSIDIFSNKGLRILVIGFKILSKEEFNKFQVDYENYNVSKNINIISNWENNINLIGSTAVEDKLIPNLNKTIKYIKESNIKLWVLTGDKLETAQQIGFSCCLLDSFENLYSIKNESDFDKFFDLKNQKLLTKNNEKYSLIIEGFLLEKIFNNKIIRQKFYNLVKDFKSCIFCRVTPIQKALIVSMVNDQKNITLAIGDGANDVSMILKAHIGVGIFGNEGRQAVINSDFAIPDFTKLDSLLFKHGRLFYLRISKTIFYFFYKNIILTINVFWFGFFSGFNGLNIYYDFYNWVYNSIVTAFPLATRVIFEQNILNYKIEYENNKNKLFNYLNLTNKNKFIKINKNINKIYPFLFDISRNNKIFTFKKFIGLFIISLSESLFIYIITVYSFNNFQNDRIICSICLITLFVINVNIKLTIETNFIWILNIFLVFLSLIIYILIILFFQNKNSIIYFSKEFYLYNLTFYLVIILGILFLVTISVTFKLLNIYLFPSEVEIINKYLKNDIKNKKGLKKMIENNEKKNKFYTDFINRY